MTLKSEIVKRNLILDPRRKGHGQLCEGQAHKKHVCSGGFHRNEVIFPKWVFQKLAARERDYFYCKINCTINCQNFHTNYGHSRTYREWHEARVRAIYGDEAVDEFINEAPLKIKRGA